jgi:prevent-host-death family protein
MSTPYDQVASPVLRVSEDIVPIAEFKAHLSERVRDLNTHGRPLVITQNGRPAAVLLTPDAFDRLTRQARFVDAVQEGLDDVDAGRVLSDDELGAHLDARFGALPRPK